MANPEQLDRRTANGFELGPPTGPAFRPSFALVGQPMPAAWQNGDALAPPVAVEVLGHFDDRRAALCAADPEPVIPCRDVFVVDQVVSLDGRPVGATTSEDLDVDNGSGGTKRLQPASSVADIDRLVGGVAPEGGVLSRRVVIGDRLPTIEPTYAGGALYAPIVWAIVTLDPSPTGSGVSRTFLIQDGGEHVSRMTDDNRPSL